MKNKIFAMLLVLTMLLPVSTKALKEETVYSNLDSYGNNYNTVVTAHLFSNEKEDINDITELKDILNINGKEKLTLNGDNLLIKSKGKDIFYQGSIEKILPITTKVTYYLNNKEVKVEDIVGKKGNIKISIDFTNNLKHTVNVNGSYENMYTPFVVTIGTILDNKTSNISVTNGKVVSTGNKNFVVAIASPGLYDSLYLSDLKSLDNITLEYTTKSFKSSDIYVVSTPKLLEKSDLNVFDKMDSLYSNVGELQNKMNLIESSSKELSEGLKKLNDNTTLLNEKVLYINSVMEELENGSVTVNDGVTKLLNSIKTIKSSIKVDEESAKNLLALKENNSKAITGILSEVATKLGMQSLTVEQFDYIYTNSNDTVKQQLASSYNLVKLLTANNTAIDSTINTSKETVTNINNILDGLYNGVLGLQVGTNKLQGGLEQINNGLNKLYEGTTSLDSYMNSAYNGSLKLSNGITLFNEQGINKITDVANSAKKYSSRLEALINLSNSYKGFASNNTETTNFVSVIKGK